MMELRYIHGIVVVNQPDLLDRAIRSVPELWPYAFILDNSDDGWVGRERDWPIPVVRPSVPLSVAQSMNFLHRLAREAGADVFLYQHNDAEAAPGTARALLERVRGFCESGRKWAAALTRYDVLSGYRVSAADEIGPWDAAFPQPNYHIDVDWFYRARLAGYEIVETGLAVTHLNVSSTLKADRRRQIINAVTFPMNDQYYCRKWGGPTHGERYIAPWDGRTDCG